MPGQGAKLTPRVVRLWPPLLQRADPIAVVMSQTMTISFRKPAELAQQNAPVPGHPGQKPTAAMLLVVRNARRCMRAIIISRSPPP